PGCELLELASIGGRRGFFLWDDGMKGARIVSPRAVLGRGAHMNRYTVANVQIAVSTSARQTWRWISSSVSNRAVDHGRHGRGELDPEGCRVTKSATGRSPGTGIT